MFQNFLRKYNKIISDPDKKEVLFWSGISFLLNMGSVLFWFIFLLIVSRMFGADGTGLFSIGQSILIILSSICLMWLNTCAIRFIWEHKQSYVFSKILYLYSISIITALSILCWILLYFFSPLIAVKIFGDPGLIIILKVTWFILPVYTLMLYNSDFLKWYKLILKWDLIKKFLFLFLSCVFILLYLFSWDRNISIPMFIYSLGILLSFWVSLFFMRPFYKKFKNIQRWNTNSELLWFKKLLKTSLPMLISVIAMIIMWNIDKLMIWYYLNTRDVWIYNVAFSMAMVLQFSLQSVNSILAPKISEKFWANNMLGLQKDINFGTKLAFCVSLPIFLMLIIFWKYILWYFWTDFIWAYYVLIILVLGQFINVISWSTGFFLNMTWNQKVLQKVVIISLFINILLNVVLIPIFWILWAAIATAFSLFSWNIFIILYIYFKYRIKIFYNPINRVNQN